MDFSNPWNLVVGAAVVALVVLAIWLMRRRRTKGCCATCPHACNCTKHLGH